MVFAAYMVFTNGPERPTVILMICAMLGLPMVFRADERNNGNLRQGWAKEDD